MWQVSQKPAVGKVAAGLWQWQLGVGHDPVSILEKSLWLHRGGGAGILNSQGNWQAEGLSGGQGHPAPQRVPTNTFLTEHDLRAKVRPRSCHSGQGHLLPFAERDPCAQRWASQPRTSILEAQMQEGPGPLAASQTWGWLGRHGPPRSSLREGLLFTIGKAEVRGPGRERPCFSASDEDCPHVPGGAHTTLRSRSSRLSSCSGCFGD